MEKQLTISQKRLYAPKKVYHVAEPKQTPRVRLESDPPEFKVTFGEKDRKSAKTHLVSQLNDESQLQKKPQISKMADQILKTRQESAYAWLFATMTGGEKLDYETLKFEALSNEVVPLIMPILIQLRDDEDLSLTCEQFIKRLQVIPVFTKAPLLKEIELMQAAAAKEEQQLKDKQLPWSMQVGTIAHSLNQKNVYRRRFDHFKIDTDLIVNPRARMTPALKAPPLTAKKGQESNLRGTQARPGTSQRLNTVLSEQNEDLSLVSPTRARHATESAEPISLQQFNSETRCDERTARNLVPMTPRQASKQSLNSTEFLKNLRLSNLSPTVKMQKKRQTAK